MLILVHSNKKNVQSTTKRSQKVDKLHQQAKRKGGQHRDLHISKTLLLLSLLVLAMVTTSSAEREDELNPSTKKIQFRVAVKKAENWKILAIAQFKRKQEEKKASLAASNASKALSTTNCEKRSSKKSKTDDSNERIEPSTKFEITQAQKQQQLDIWIRELELISQNSTASKERVKQLHLARSQLLWLLKKASRHERQMVHENLSNFATHNP